MINYVTVLQFLLLCLFILTPIADITATTASHVTKTRKRTARRLFRRKRKQSSHKKHIIKRKPKAARRRKKILRKRIGRSVTTRKTRTLHNTTTIHKNPSIPDPSVHSTPQRSRSNSHPYSRPSLAFPNQLILQQPYHNNTLKTKLLDSVRLLDPHHKLDSSAVAYEFQISYRDEEQLIQAHYDDRIQKFGTCYLNTIPLIGHYQNKKTKEQGATIGEYYNLKKRIAFIECSPTCLILPHALLDEIGAILDIPYDIPVKEQLSQLIMRIPTIAFNIVFSSNVEEPLQDSDRKPNSNILPQKTYNLVYHPWTGNYATSIGKMNDYCVYPYMGYFAASGVSNASGDEFSPHGPLTYNQLAQKQVHWHGAMSPDNARIAIDKKRDISTFWAAAFSEDKKYLTVSYHLLFNTPKVQDEAEEICADAITVRDLLEKFSTMTGKLDCDEDRSALTTTLDVINTIIEHHATQKQYSPR